MEIVIVDDNSPDGT
jgi:dolichol-phosphate mannosyltransferase